MRLLSGRTTNPITRLWLAGGGDAEASEGQG